MARWFTMAMLGLAVTTTGSTALAARLVSMTVTLDGKKILVSSAGDNGRPLPDEVWGYLAKAVFKATDDFPAVEAEADGHQLLGDPAKGDIQVRVHYGGSATTHRLNLIRVPMERRGEWKIDRGDIQRLFETRTTGRRRRAVKPPR